MTKTDNQKNYQNGNYMGLGQLYGNKHPLLKTSVGMTALMGLLLLSIWAYEFFIGTDFSRSATFSIGVPMGMIFAIVLGAAFGFFAVKKLACKAQLWHFENLFVVQKGFSKSNIQWTKIENIQVCDVDLYRSNPQKSEESYRIRAHMKDGSYRYLLYTDTSRIKSKEMARKLNGIIAVQNEMIVHPKQTIANTLHGGKKTIDWQPSADEEDIRFVHVNVGTSNFVGVNAPVYFIDEKGNLQRVNTGLIAILSLLMMGAIALVVFFVKSCM